MSNAEPHGIVPAFTLGDRLRKAREHATMTLVDMAAVHGVSERTIRNWESESTPIKRTAGITWALSTGVSFDWLWTGTVPADGPEGEGVTMRETAAVITLSDYRHVADGMTSAKIPA